jgi:hypothetical protein
MNSLEIVHAFWEEVWNAHDSSAVDRFVVDDGSRVASRWLLTGKNNGFLGTEPDQQDIAMTGTAVWAVNGDGKLLTNWVERASWEQFQRLIGAGK